MSPLLVHSFGQVQSERNPHGHHFWISIYFRIYYSVVRLEKTLAHSKFLDETHEDEEEEEEEEDISSDEESIVETEEELRKFDDQSDQHHSTNKIRNVETNDILNL